MFFFFFNDTATTEIYTLSLHDALPICRKSENAGSQRPQVYQSATCTTHLTLRRSGESQAKDRGTTVGWPDRKSTRLNSSHANISYAVFCLKKKKTQENQHQIGECDRTK